MARGFAGGGLTGDEDQDRGGGGAMAAEHERQHPVGEPMCQVCLGQVVAVGVGHRSTGPKLGRADTSPCQRARFLWLSERWIRATLAKSTATSAVISATV